MNYKRKKPRIHGRSKGQLFGGSRKGEAPSHWNIIHNNRPKRRRDKENCYQLLRGKWHSDEITWELGNRKPHEYYW